ncbi:MULTISPECIES: restriction endonuclease subunit S [unclassified Shewanella]|uniref:restriction endonuclease subunit S n=1 Tax=unclassified Shewanella TaxID=196818 RepID=UPI0039B68C77
MSQQTRLSGKYTAYPEYKDSGVEWLGDVPIGWVVTKTTRFFKIAMGQTILREQLDETGNWPVYSATEGDHFFGYINEPQVRLRDGDLVIPARGNSIGAVKLVNREATTTQTTIYCKHITNRLVAKYAFYYMLGNRKNLFRFMQTAIPQITVEEVGTNSILLPSEVEQRTIAAFLDYETARIDSLIDKQQRLIELLKEKRQAVISHAVTKGLNPDAPMKDSGVEWLGQVPEHWVVSPLKYHCSFSGGGTPSKENTSYWNGSIPWVSPKDMKSYWITDSEDKITEQAVVESSTNLIAAGAVLIVVRSGILQRTIPVGINTIPVTINQDMKAIRFKSIAYAQYISMFIKGYEQSLLLDWRKQGATVESLEHEYLANTLIPFPPEEEVLEIIRNLTQKLQKFDQIECDTTKAISLLQERRTALISAAVTGKIDLRGWTQPVKEDAA